jgi:hypothetical protein
MFYFLNACKGTDSRLPFCLGCSCIHSTNQRLYICTVSDRSSPWDRFANAANSLCQFIYVFNRNAFFWTAPIVSIMVHSSFISLPPLYEMVLWWWENESLDFEGFTRFQHPWIRESGLWNAVCIYICARSQASERLDGFCLRSIFKSLSTPAVV